MSIQKAEMSIEQIENGQIVEHVAYPYVEYEHVTMENGMDIMSMIRDDVSTPMVTHNTTNWKVGQGDSNVSETIVDSSVASMTIKGQTYQNILPEPSLRNSMTNGKTMQKLNEGYESVNTVDGVCKSAILMGQTLVNYATGMEFALSNGADYCIGILKNSEMTSNKTITIVNNNSYGVRGIVTNLNGGWIRNINVSAKSYTTSTLTSSEKLLRVDSLPNSGILLNDYVNSRFIIYDGGFKDIPYFTGMQSVRMPVLTTSNEEGTKTNILTTSEEVVLRGIGEVQDTLDCLMGEVTQAIYEYTFTGDEDWRISGGGSGGYTYFSFGASQLPIRYSYSSDTNIPIMSDRLPLITYRDLDDGLKSVGINLSYFFRLNFSDCDSNNGATVEDLKAYLKANPTTVQYPISKSVKTVDLSILDQDNQPTTQLNSFANGYIQVSSQGLIPSVDYEVPTSNSYHVDLMKPNTQYTMKNMQGTFTIDNIQYNASTNGTFTSPSTLSNKFMVTNVAQTQPMLLEGDITNKTIPYFKGIKSAFEDESKIEVLSTGKNLYPYGDSNFIAPVNSWIYTNGKPARYGTNCKRGDGGNWFYLPAGKYSLTFNNPNTADGQTVQTVQLIGEGEKIISPKDCAAGWYVLRIGAHYNQNICLLNIQIEESPSLTPTPHEPYKSNITKIPLLSPLRSLPNGVHDEIVLDRENNKAKIIQRVGEDLTQLETPIITEVNLEGYPYVYKGGHIFLNTEIAPTTEVTYSINQAHQIESSNEDILRHQNEINHLYELIAQYVQVQYEAELIDIALQG